MKEDVALNLICNLAIAVVELEKKVIPASDEAIVEFDDRLTTLERSVETLRIMVNAVLNRVNFGEQENGKKEEEKETN